MPESKRKGIYLLPNLLTTAGLFSGFYAVVASMNGHFEAAAVAIFIAMIFDGLDGRVARMTNTQSEFGAEYDSMADMASASPIVCCGRKMTDDSFELLPTVSFFFLLLLLSWYCIGKGDIKVVAFRSLDILVLNKLGLHLLTYLVLASSSFSPDSDIGESATML